MDLLLLLDKLGELFEIWGYLIVFFGSLIEITPFGWAVPGGVILVISGYLTNGDSKLELIPVVFYGTLGTWTAFLLAYLLGTKTGMWLVNKLKQQKNAELAKRMLKSNGPVILTTSMMANLTRFWISYIAGVDKYSFLKFNIYAILASLSWVSMLTLLGYFAGYERENLRSIVNSVGILAWVLLTLAFVVIYKSIKHEYKHFKEDLPHEVNVK